MKFRIVKNLASELRVWIKIRLDSIKDLRPTIHNLEQLLVGIGPKFQSNLAD